MKTFIISIFLCLISITCFGKETKPTVVEKVLETSENSISTIYNDTKETVKTVYNDSKDLASNLYPEIKEAVVSIAKGIGIAAEHLYGVLIKKYIVISIGLALKLLVGIILIITPIIMVCKSRSPIKLKGHEGIKLLCMLASFIIGLIISFGVNIEEMLMGIINPEYGAINYIIEYSKSVIH